EGFIVVKDFADAATRERMLDTIVDMVRRADAGEDIAPAYVVPESVLEKEGERPEDRVSKVFRVHREVPVFRDFVCQPRLVDLVGGVLGPDVDCFLSQFIFKLPGALGQPWHQDAFYFPFDREPQVGAWLALTETTPENGPLWVLPRSHTEPLHQAVRDTREHANMAYVEIVDHDTRAAVPVLLDPGDLIVFHSHLFHKSSDNTADYMRAAMVYHFGEGGTVDHSEEKWGVRPPNVDWMPIRRGGSPVEAPLCHDAGAPASAPKDRGMT
ncbi:MAG: phytanoyl-CoA dioxygenase family protein, partial [Deltaproteobacteria bacterium]|nr:phytanoyl-CoA dioxygenase family protein [Deltaproteobacteria bacterium]